MCGILDASRQLLGDRLTLWNEIATKQIREGPVDHHTLDAEDRLYVDGKSTAIFSSPMPIVPC